MSLKHLATIENADSLKVSSGGKLWKPYIYADVCVSACHYELV